MNQYIEYIFLENFIVNFILMYFVKIFSRQKVSKIFFIIGVLVISIYSCISNVYQDFLNLFIVKILVIFIGVFIVFIPKSIALYVRAFCYYVMIFLIFLGATIGVTLIFNFNISNIINKIIVYIISFIITYLITKMLWNVWKKEIKNNSFNVKIVIQNEILDGFVDTGNTVKDLNNNPIIFISDEYKEKFDKDKAYNIDILTINSKNNQEVYTLKQINIKFKNKEKIFNNVNVIFTGNINQKEYQAIVGYDYYLELL